MKRIRGYRYRAYPDKKQQEFFSKNFGSCRYVYNHYLAKRKAEWEEWHDTMSYKDTAKDLAKNLKKEKEWLKEADSSALQQSLRHLDNAYQNFFSKRAGYPKFKRRRSDQSYRTMNNNNSIRRLQRELSRKKNGSKNREKARIRLARAHEKVADIRNDFQHKMTYRLASDNQVVCIEDLNVKGMMRNHRLAGAISDASWSEFFRKLEYKMDDRGGTLIRVPRTFPSSQKCSCCGRQNREVRDLSVRTWICPECGTKHDRDVNAAVNILAKGLEMLAS